MISILMPVNNTALYLKECIESIQSQTHTDWELIAVDDFSTDNSKEVLLALAHQDERIKVFANEQKGLNNALQLAYKKSCGAFITRMDSDDINAPHKYATMQAQLLKSGKGHIALGQVKYFSKEGIGDGFSKYEQWLNKLIAKGKSFTDIYKECSIPSPCWMVHRSDFDHCGGFNIAHYPEDYDLAFRFYKNRLQPIASNEILLHWRDRPDRTSRNDPNYFNEKMLFLKCFYFIDIDYNAEQKLILWGAGKRGKFIAKFLVEHNISFDWVCNNPKKIGKEIYGKKLLESKNTIKHLVLNTQIINAVAKLELELDKYKLRKHEVYYFV